jgi:hypothetical protein
MATYAWNTYTYASLDVISTADLEAAEITLPGREATSFSEEGSVDGAGEDEEHISIENEFHSNNKYDKKLFCLCVVASIVDHI